MNRFGTKKSEFKYILLWTGSDTEPLTFIGEGQSGFISRKCPYTNCIVTANRSLLRDYTLFDVIAFDGPQLFDTAMTNDFPTRRSPHQKYVFVSIESSSNYPVCSHYFDSFFNWTWTYRLDSDLRWGYFLIKDAEGAIIGPKKDMHWLSWNSMSKVNAKMKEKLMNSKTKAVVWFVSNCRTKNRREEHAFALDTYLRGKYNLEVDIYGECGLLNCSRLKEEECHKLIENYYFYLSFENAFSEDYVTEKLLIPLQYNAIPIVYGGADYSRFLPQGSYLNAQELGLNYLSSKIYELIKNPDSYMDYFKWKNHYSYHKMSERPETDEYCKMEKYIGTYFSIYSRQGPLGQDFYYTLHISNITVLRIFLIILIHHR